MSYKIASYDGAGLQDITVEIEGTVAIGQSPTSARFTSQGEEWAWIDLQNPVIQAIPGPNPNQWASYRLKGTRADNNANVFVYLTDVSSASGDMRLEIHAPNWSARWFDQEQTAWIDTYEAAFGLVATWNFDDDTGDDSVGSANGTVTDLTYATADGITYAEADGSGNKMDLGTPAALDLGTSDFTISGWANMDSIPTGASGAILYNKGMTSLSSPQFNGTQISFYQGNVRFYVGGQGSYTTISEPMSTGQWYHFMGTRSGTTMKFYINGVLVDTQDTGTVKDITTSLNGTIFSNYNGTWYTDTFDGKLADIRIWSRALSDGEATSVHATGPEVSAALEDSLVAKYPLDSDGVPSVGDVTFTASNVTYGAGESFSTFASQNSGYYVNSPYLDLADEYTLSFWFKDLKSRAAAPYGFLMAAAYNKETGGVGGYANWDHDTSYDVVIYTNDMLGAYGHANASAGASTLNSTGYQMTQALYNGTGWHHMACAFSGGQMTYYINGVQVGVPVSTTGMDKLQTIGSYTDMNYAAFEYMDDFRVYNKAISADDAAALHAEGAEAPAAPAAPAAATYELTVFQTDSYGDSWNGGNIAISDANGTAIQTFSGPTSGVIAPAGLTETVSVEAGTYTYVVTPGAWPSEIAILITDPDGVTLASLAGDAGTGTFTVTAPASAITPSTSVSGAAITVSATVNAAATAEGAANWSASLTGFGEVGATIDGAKALTALGVDAVLTVASGGTHTVYAAVVDGSGVILAKSSVDASVFMSKIAVSDQMIVMAYLEHPSLSPQGTHAQLTNDDGDLKWGPFYIGDLTIKTAVNEVNDPSEIGTVVTFDDGSGGTLDMDGLVKEMIKKYDLNMLWGDNSADGLFFQAVLDGTNGVNPSELLGWSGEDTNTVMLAADGGGWYADYDTRFVAGYPNAGDLMISETTPGDGMVSGPDGSSFLGIIAPGDTHENSPVGAATKVRVRFAGALYTTTIVVKDGNGDYFATYAPEAMAYGQEQYHADAHAARDAGTMIQMGDANGHNTDFNSTPKGQAIGIATALDGGGPYDVVNRTFEYEMTFPEGNYSVQLHAGVGTPDGSNIYILDANDNLVAQAQGDAGGFDTAYHAITVGSPVAAAAAAYQWDHGGELTHIKHFSAGYSVIGADAYGYTKEEPSDNTTTLYFASDLKTLSTFTEYDAASTGIEGSPSCLTYGTNNLWLLGTSAGKVYEIALLSVDSSTAFFDERWSNATGEAINAMKFDANTGRWIFETEDSLYTMDQGGANVQSQLSLAAGEKIVDIQSGEGHIVYVVRKADYSFELFVCDSSWANIKDSASMQPILASHEAIDVNYDADSDLWTASSASGVVISTDDLSNWLI
jgi:hypothetical protein